MRYKLFVLAIFSSFLIIVACHNDIEETSIDEEIISDYFSEFLQDFSGDAILLIDAVEEQHPIFLLEDLLPEDYNERRQSFLEQTSEPMTQTEFLFLAQRYITALKDGHMLIRTGEQFLNVDWIYIDGGLFIIDDDYETQEIIEIANIPVTDIIEMIAYYYYFENDAERQFLISVFSRDVDLLIRAGATINDEVEVKFYDGRDTSYQHVSMMSGNMWVFSEIIPHNFIVNYEEMTDIFYIDLRSFEFDPTIDSTIMAIEEAMENDVRYFIVDLRDNGGGHSGVGELLLNAMEITPPSFGGLLRLSEPNIASLERFGSTLADMFGEGEYDEYVERGYFIEEPNLEMASNPNEVFVSVLVNANTYSSAMWFGVWVQDGGFGNVIGEYSRNAPTSFGNTAGEAFLPESQIHVSISTARWLRPDIEANQNMLVPDILAASEDALDVAIDFLSAY